MCGNNQILSTLAKLSPINLKKSPHGPIELFINLLIQVVYTNRDPIYEGLQPSPSNQFQSYKHQLVVPFLFVEIITITKWIRLSLPVSASQLPTNFLQMSNSWDLSLLTVCLALTTTKGVGHGLMAHTE